ncbi:MAG: hypothetical protein K5883_04365 [Pseudobutyrivibrio sp.]|nr:hypothetical protein [Pseudobutyrivibrio sp.]
MRLKYYLRGIGVGVIFATLLLSISFYFGRDNLHKKDLSDEEIIARAQELGMVMPEDSEDSNDTEDDKEDTKEKDKEGDAEEQAPIEEEPTDESEKTDEEITGEVSEVLESKEASEMKEDTDESTVTYVPFSVHGGESSDTVAYNLYKNGLVDSSDKFNKYMNSLGVDDRIQSGTFYVKQGSSYDDLIALLVNKDTRTTTPPQ